jgi:G3E family GTPase
MSDPAAPTPAPVPAPRLPMTVIGGYLGAGKTTLINQLLQAPHGRRLMVMVNDFGAINIDAALLQSADEDTLTLTNGCVCCTMGADLFLAIGDVLDRRPRPDHLIVEASGIADPQKIANAALAEPDLSYGGIVTLVDAQNFAALQDDVQIGPQIEAQLRCADLLLVSKTEALTEDLNARLKRLSAVVPLLTEDSPALADLLLQDIARAPTTLHNTAQNTAPAHPSYMRWSHQSSACVTKAALRQALRNRPAALYRLKGFVQGEGSAGWLLHCVGQQISLEPIQHDTGTTLVGIGLADQLTAGRCEAWWSSTVSSLMPSPIPSTSALAE